MRILSLIFFASSAFCADPFVYYRGVVNPANYAPRGTPGGAIARGSIFSIFGRNLGPAQFAVAGAYPLQITLGGVSIEILQKGQVTAAIPIFCSASQVNAILPSTLQAGRVSLRVTVDGAKSNWTSVDVADQSPALISVNGTGFGPGVIQNFVTVENQPLNSLRSPAKPGQTVTLWATGLGPIAASDMAAPPVGDVAASVQVTVAGIVAKRLYSGRAPCCAGTDQIVFEIPAAVPFGCYVPVQVRSGNVTSTTVTMAVTAGGEPCAGTFPAALRTFAAGGKIGFWFSSRVSFREQDLNGAPTVSQSDQAFASFRQEAASDFAFHPLLSLPPAGSCLTYLVPGNLIQRSSQLDRGASVKNLDAGLTVNLTGPAGPLALPRLEGNFLHYFSLLGTDFSAPGAGAPVFSTGTTRAFNSPGGPDTGPVTGTVQPHAGLLWTNRDALATVNRTQGFRVDWAGADPKNDLVIIAGAAYNTMVNASGMWVCAADPAAGSFIVPPGVLAVVPASSARASVVDASVMVGTVPLSGSGLLNATGLDAGYVFHGAWSGRLVQVQ